MNTDNKWPHLKAGRNVIASGHGVGQIVEVRQYDSLIDFGEAGHCKTCTCHRKEWRPNHSLTLTVADKEKHGYIS